MHQKFFYHFWIFTTEKSRNFQVLDLQAPQKKLKYKFIVFLSIESQTVDTLLCQTMNQIISYYCQVLNLIYFVKSLEKSHHFLQKNPKKRTRCPISKFLSLTKVFSPCEFSEHNKNKFWEKNFFLSDPILKDVDSSKLKW